MLVFVLNIHDEPLMPCKPTKARKLLEEEQTKVVNRNPFTIQMIYGSSGYKQDVKLGIDPGYSTVGFSAITKNEELISGELKLRTNMSKSISDKAMYRRNRRGRLWYRQPRFNNRSKPKGWLAPSIKHKLDTHERLINKLIGILPITKIIIEIAKFDTQKMQNPEISGVEYQQGKLQGYNVKDYLLEKFKYQCTYCGKSNIPLEVEHIIPKSRGGSNRVSNLTIACHKCNQKKGNQTAKEFGYPGIQKQAKKTLRSTSFMNIVHRRLFDDIKRKDKNIEVKYTYGYKTKYRRLKQKLDKTHSNDAFVIVQGKNQLRCEPYELTQTKRNNRKLQTNRNGYKPSIRKQRYNFQPNDLVKHNGILYRSKGVFSYGKQILLVDSVGTKTNSNIKKVELITYGKGIQFT